MHLLVSSLDLKEVKDYFSLTTVRLISVKIIIKQPLCLCVAYHFIIIIHAGAHLYKSSLAEQLCVG